MESSVHISHNKLGLCTQHVSRDETGHLFKSSIEEFSSFFDKVSWGGRILDSVLYLAKVEVRVEHKLIRETYKVVWVKLDVKIEILRKTLLASDMQGQSVSQSLIRCLEHRLHLLEVSLLGMLPGVQHTLQKRDLGGYTSHRA